MLNLDTFSVGVTLDFLNKSVDFVEIKYMNMNERNNVLRKTSFSSSRNYYRSQFIQQLNR